MKFNFDNRTFEVYQSGNPDNPRVLLVTGFIGHSSFWSSVEKCLEDKYHITTYDQRGTGLSGEFTSPLSMQQMVDDARTILKVLVGKPAHIIGHSAGAGIAMMLAAQHPHLVESISLLGGWTKADTWMHRVFSSRLKTLDESGPLAYTKLTTLFMNPPSHVSKLDPSIIVNEESYSISMPSYSDIKERSTAVLNFDSNAWASSVNCPTLVIGAADDIMTPFYFSEELAGSITNAILRELPIGGHYFPRNNPTNTSELLLAFLNNQQA